MKLSKMKLNMKLSKKDQMHLLRAIVIGLVLGLVLVVATDVVLESTGSQGFFGLFGMPVCGDGKCATMEKSWCYADCGRPSPYPPCYPNCMNGTNVTR